MKIINKILEIDLDNTTTIEAFNIFYSLQSDLKKIYKKLYKLGFIYQGIQPFPELKLLPNDPKNTFIIHDYLFDNIREENIQWR